MGSIWPHHARAQGPRVLKGARGADDAELIVRALPRAGRTVTVERVETSEAMATALEKGGWDVVISDQSMPHLSGSAALGAVSPGAPEW